MSKRTQRRLLYALGLAFFIIAFACAIQWFGLAFTAGDAMAAQQSVHPYTEEQMRQWHEMGRRADPWFYAAAVALAASFVLFFLGMRHRMRASSEGISH